MLQKTRLIKLINNQFYNMPEEIMQAAVSGEFSIIVALIGSIASLVVAFLTAYLTSANECKKIHYNFVEKLYEKRYETYTKLLEITQEIGKDKAQIDFHKNARKALKKWQMESGGYLLLSKNSLDGFNRLKDMLKKNPEKQDEYSEEQRKNLFNARNAFRGSLRDDFDFFHSAEKNIKNN
jgi:hypothetical protein